MPKYVVRISEVFTFDYEVEAENEEDAKKKAEEFIETSDFEGVYDYTIDPDEWVMFEVS